eukprot:855093-Pleurochrysis_carterae.AAC.1
MSALHTQRASGATSGGRAHTFAMRALVFRQLARLPPPASNRPKYFCSRQLHRPVAPMHRAVP